MHPQNVEVTELLSALPNGGPEVWERLVNRVYRELRQMAREAMKKERAGHTLSPTALVHETFLKMVPSASQASFKNRAYFFGAAARAMEQVLINYARMKSRKKRNNGVPTISLNSGADLTFQIPDEASDNNIDILALHAALSELESHEKTKRKAEVVYLIYFDQLSVREVAPLLGVSEKTVRNDWLFAKTWIHNWMKRKWNDSQ